MEFIAKNAFTIFLRHIFCEAFFDKIVCMVLDSAVNNGIKISKIV